MSRQGRLEITAPAAGEPAPPGRWQAPVRHVLTVLGIAAALVGLFWGYLLQSRTQGSSSDAAGMVLQGTDMIQHGNLLLRGWVDGDVSFYTFEIPIDGLVSAVYGLRIDVVHVAAAIEYALLVLFAALVAAGAARDRRGGRWEAWTRGLLAAGIMVAPGLVGGSGVLGRPHHTAIGVPVLITLLIVDRLVPRRWLPAAATLLLIFVLLVWAQLDDLVATLSCAVPLAVVCGLSVAAFLIAAGVRRLIRLIRRWRGRPKEAPPRLLGQGAQSPAYDAALAALAAASYGVTELLLKGIWRIGGFYLRAIPAQSQISHWSTVPAQLPGARSEPADPVRRRLLGQPAAADRPRLPAPGLRRRRAARPAHSPSSAGRR